MPFCPTKVFILHALSFPGKKRPFQGHIEVIFCVFIEPLWRGDVLSVFYEYGAVIDGW